jgi:hypothetical protein
MHVRVALKPAIVLRLVGVEVCAAEARKEFKMN